MRTYTLPQLVAAVTALLALAFVVPACLALRLNRDRLTRAEDDVRVIAGSLASAQQSRLIDMAGRVDLLAGPGDVPRVEDSAAQLWQNGRTDPLNTAEPDPWGHRYAVNVGALSPSQPAGAVIWVLSAGPNGIVETPFVDRTGAARCGGDDIGLQLMSTPTAR